MKRVLLFLAQGFEAYEASVFTDVLGWSRAFGTEPVDLQTTALRSEIRCTWNLNVRPEIEFGANVQDEMIVVDKNIITSTGPSTALDVAFRLLDMLTNAENVNIVKKYMRIE
jgi:putative intracellular protease/amidase